MGKIKMPKVKAPKMPSTKDINKAFNDAGNAIKDTANDAGKAVEKTANDVAKEAEKTAYGMEKAATDLYKDAAKAATDAYNYSVSLANDTAAVTKSVANTVAKNTEEAAKQGINVASDEWKKGSALAVEAYKEGAEAVEKAAEDAYAWLDANACYIGLNFALTTGCVAYFTPKPAPADPGTVNSAAISTTWVAWFAAQGGKAVTKAETMVLSSSIAYIVNEGIFMIPGVKGQINKDLMFKVLANSINASISNAYLWATPAGVGIAVGSAISPIIATLVCEGVLPKGASAGIDAKAQEQGVKMAKDALKALGL
jgi:hypothetical protein